jgi:hypothetical protein
MREPAKRATEEEKDEALFETNGPEDSRRLSPTSWAGKLFLCRFPGFRFAPPWALCCRPLSRAR